MENKRDDISAGDLLAKLKANIVENENGNGKDTRDTEGRKVYRFRRSQKVLSVTEEDIDREMQHSSEEPTFVSPVPRSEDEDLDIDALMKKYLPEEDYSRLTKTAFESLEEEDEMVRTLTSLEIVSAEEEDDASSKEEVLTAPDSQLYATLSAGGKVCDVPGEEDELSDTKRTPLKPMTSEERAFLFGEPTEEEIGAVREVAAAENYGEVLDPSVLGTENDETESQGDASLPSEEKVETSPFEAVSYEQLTFGETQVLAPEVSEAAPLRSTEGDTRVISLNKEEGSGEDIPTGETRVFSLKEEAEQVKHQIEGTVSDAPTVAFDSTAIEEEQALVPADAESGDEAIPSDIYEESFDETDANLMLAFGMDEELDEAIGKESADKLRSRVENLIPEEEEKPARKTFELPKEPLREFVSPTETKEIFEKYKLAYVKNAVRMFALIALAVILFFFENIKTFGGHLIDAFNPAYYPVVHLMVGLQILLLGYALMYRQVYEGLRGLLEKKPIPESFLPISLVVTVLYTVFACFFPAGTTFVTFYFPAMLCLLLSVFSERMALRREILSFNIVSSKRTKFALETLELDDAELETRAFDQFLPQQTSIFKINKTAFIDGYFRRQKAYPSIKLVLNAMLPLSLVALVAGVLVGLFVSRSFSQAVMLGYTVFSFALPASVFFTFSLPAFKAAKSAFADKSAFVGEAAMDEYTTAGSISFDDREVFPTGGVKLRSIKVFGSGRLDNVIYNLAAIYSQIGGPLSDVLNVATADLGRAEDVEILSIEADGVEALVEGRHLFAGKANYLRKNGFMPVADPDDEEIENGGELSIMFLVCNDEVIAKIYVRYRIEPEFEITLKNLYRSGICVGIKTVDPNINDEMLSTRIRLSKYPVRVLKYSDLADSRRGADRTDSGIVSRKSAKALLHTFTLCDKMKHVTKTNLLVNFMAMILGVALALTVSFMSGGNLSVIQSAHVVLYQAFWLIPMYLMSKITLI